jgi:phosphotriesterase-related protein
MKSRAGSGRVSRRDLLAGAAALLGSACARAPDVPASPEAHAEASIETVMGRIAADRLGVTLMHEHVLVDFIGADRVSPERYDPGDVVRVVVPHLERIRQLGCETLVECTPAYLGRDPRLLQRLSEESGLNILTNTGYYGAADDKYLPPHAFSETAELIAARWVREHERGLDGSPIRPAFMKIGVDRAPLSDVDRKLVRAAALAHRAAGLPIASHTASGAAAVEELDILERAGVSPAAFIWVHAQNERDAAFHVGVARRGAWVEFDGIGPASVARHVELVGSMREARLFDRVLVSQDAGWYRVGEPGGGEFRPYDTMFTTFVPALEAAGFGALDVRQLLVVNPRRALALRT